MCIITSFKKASKLGLFIFILQRSHIFLLKKGNIKIVAVDQDANESIADIILRGDLFDKLALENAIEMKKTEKPFHAT